MRTRPARILAAVAILAAALACAARADAIGWRRQLDFAKRLYKTYGYTDLAETVVDKLLADPTIKGDERGALYKAMGEYHLELVEGIRGANALKRVTEHLAKAREFFDKYIAHPVAKRDPAALFSVRRRVVWFGVNLARTHVRMLEDPGVPKAEHPKHRASAVAAYKKAIKEFERLVAEKRTEETRLKAVTPKEKKARAKWEVRYNQVRTEHVGVRILLNNVRFELGKFLKTHGANTKEWRPYIEAAAKDYKKMLYECTDAKGLKQINVYYAEAIVELGPERDKEALERLDEVWRDRRVFADHKAVPCKAMHIKATILFRQKKYAQAIETLDEMLKARTGGGWDVDRLKIDLVGARVADMLKNLDEGEIPEQYDARAVAKSLLLEADAYAARAKAAEDAKKPRKQVQHLYRMAYEIGVGVWDARMPMQPKYVKLIEFWRKKSGAPPSMAALMIQVADALRKARKDPSEYLRAAKLYTQVVARTTPEPEQLRSVWENIARCYYAGGDNYAAYIVFTALSRWFPEPRPQAYSYARMAIAVVKAERDRDEKTQASQGKIAFDKNLLEKAYLSAEPLSPLGPGAATIGKARQLRSERKFAEAIRLLKEVQPGSKAYPYALHELALTYRAIYLAVPDAQKKTLTGQRALRNALDAFQASLDYARKKLPTFTEEQAEERKVVRDAAVTGITVYCDLLLSRHVNQPAKVIELTSDLKRTYPGIETSPNYGFITYNRMRAAYTLATTASGPAAARALAVLEDTWKEIKTFEDFKYLANACKMGANAHNKLAQQFEAEAKKQRDPAAKAKLQNQAIAERSRALSFYLELLEVAPRQTLNTYRYVLYQLDKRPHEPKSADYRKMIELANKALELFGGDQVATDEIAQVRLMLASAHCRLGAWRDAIPILEQINAAYEKEYQRRLRRYEQAKALHEKNPARYPTPRYPARHPIQAQAREWLGRAYIQTNARSKFKDAQSFFADQLRLYPKFDSPKAWRSMYLLCMAFRLDGRYEDAVKCLFRAAAVIDRNPIASGEASRKDFLAEAARLRKAIEALPDPKRRNGLLPSMDTIERNLGK